jgi:hypothetical protein
MTKIAHIIPNIGCRLAATVLTLAFALGVLAPGSARAGDLFFAAGGAFPHLEVSSMAEQKFSTVVRQQYDFSCGSAALATLLTHHYDRPTSETDAFQAMWEVGDQDRIRELGFSLLEMKRYLEKLGLTADGFKLTLERIQEIGVPGIALITVKGYRHFVVIKGITSKHVLIGDPSSGVLSLPRAEFNERWDGTILFIRSDVQRGKANFNHMKDWRLAPTAPHDRALDGESLQSISINQTRPAFSGFNIGAFAGSP